MKREVTANIDKDLKIESINVTTKGDKISNNGIKDLVELIKMWAKENDD